ncbi:NmrA family protein [Brevundimonas sp. LM2]|uniref:NmrA/HSCARG family protein n=1 Tax=Brevundimonas sp. LM2 TaxID=1938605 RepID=UPI000983D1AC|nr:NmrA/HSCARG family protein [Brevundimonas sp. LM2]AQR63123.1 NmrA family protein [Brevundimonas sp. LM2]
MTNPIILITGATGNQGGATIRELLRRGGNWQLRALVRNPTAPKALALALQGVDLVKGDLDDAGSIRAALSGVYGVLAVQTPMEQGPAGEERQGRLLASLAAEAGVQHFVYCSAGGVDRDSGVPHFESKRAIEAHIHKLQLPSTILRPAAFMEMFDGFAFRITMLSMMRTYLKRDQAMQLVSARDIGWFAAQAFDHPTAHIGRAIEIAGDSVTRAEAIKSLRRAGRHSVVSFTIPVFMRSRLPEDFRLMFEWIAREGFRGDLAQLRSEHPGLLTLSAWSTLPTPEA